MNLYEEYPNQVEYLGRKYKLNLSFDAVLASIDVFSDDQLTDDLKVEIALDNLILNSHPVDSNLLDAIFSMLFPKKDISTTKEQFLDLNQDASLIVAAFFQTYGINLREEKINWFLFLELLNGLPKCTRLREVIEIRMMPIPKPTKYNAEERSAIIKAKAEVALKKKKQNLEEALFGVYKMLEAKAKEGR